MGAYAIDEHGCVICLLKILRTKIPQDFSIGTFPYYKINCSCNVNIRKLLLQQLSTFDLWQTFAKLGLCMECRKNVFMT